MKIIIIVAVIFIIYKVITKHRSSTPPSSNSIQSDIPRQPVKRSNPHRILICDDAAFMRMQLKSTLTQDGYEVVAEAQNGLEAIERYSEFKPDLVFMDITMPIMDGIDAIRKIKEMDSRANIVVCSAMGQQGPTIEAIRSGAKTFIVKPYTKEAILKAVMEIFEPWRIAKPPVESEQSQTPTVQEQSVQNQTASTKQPTQPQDNQAQATSTTPPVQTKNKQNQSTDNSPTVNYPFDLNYAPELCFFTNTSLSDKFPKTAGQGEMIIRYPVINVDVNIVELAIIVDDCLIQFSEDGKMHALNIPENTAYAYEISGRNAHQDLLKWVKETVLAVAPKQINTVKKNPGAMQWLRLYSTILFYYTTNEIDKETYNTAMQTLREGFRLAPNDETIRIVNRQWYYNKERKTWGNIAVNIFRDYFKEFSTYHN